VTGEERLRLASLLRARRDDLADRATQMFYIRHPEWWERFGPQGRERTRQDSAYNIDFLAGAADTGSAESFAAYCLWSARMLESRGISREVLIDHYRDLKCLVAELPAPDACYLSSLIDAGVAALRSGERPESDAPDPSTSVFIDALLIGNRAAALAIALDYRAQGRSLLDVYTGLLEPSLYRIGSLWELNRISVAREHIATAIVQYVMIRLFEYPGSTRPDQRALVTGVRGEQHQVGAMMIADMFSLYQWDVRFLGTDIPETAILDSVQEFLPNMVAISTTMLFNVRQVRELIGKCRTIVPTARVIVGGAVFRANPDLYQEIHADGFAPDVKTAASLFAKN